MIMPRSMPEEKQTSRVLAKYVVPIGNGTAELTFTGDKLTAGDFVALKEFLRFAKRQRQKQVSPIEPCPQI